MDHAEALAWAQDWTEAWNAHDLDRVLAHFTDDAEFSSPLVAVVTGQPGPLHGRAAMADYWREGLRRLPGLHFTLRGVRVGADVIAIDYANERGDDCLEVLAVGDDGLATRGWALYRRAGSA